MASKVLLFSSLLTTVAAMDMGGRPGYGLIGYGINMYNPVCASACHDSAPMTMHCANGSDSSMTMSGDEGAMPSAECVAASSPFLETVAYCVMQHCPPSLSMAARNYWWTHDMMGRKLDQPMPSMTYEQALQSALTIPPNAPLASPDSVLLAPVLVDDATYLSNLNALVSFQGAEKTHSQLAIALIVIGVLGPIALSILQCLPSLPLQRKVSSHLVERPWLRREVHLNNLFGTGRAVTLHLPTRGQTLLVAAVWVLNIIFSSVGYRSYQPNAYFASTRLEILTYITNRTGALSFVNFVLLILYAGRNNPLLTATGWSHSTYLLLHKHVASIATTQACLHSAIYLQIKLADGTFSTEEASAYWIWGAVATIAMSLLLVLSLRSLRNAVYEIFLIMHILLAVVALIGCWYHIYLRFQHQWGYETWLYIAFAVWGAERALRIVRLVLYSDVETASVSALDEDYLQIVIPGAHHSPWDGGVIYLYFPTLSWRPWESHPFSVAGPATSEARGPSGSGSHLLSEKEKGIPARPADLAYSTSKQNKSKDEIEASSFVDGEKVETEDEHKKVAFSDNEGSPLLQSSNGIAFNGGLTFFVRVRRGTTARLAKRASRTGPASSVPVLLEGAYDRSRFGGRSLTQIIGGSHARNGVRKGMMMSRRYARIICIAGGVGITALLPVLHRAAALNSAQREETEEPTRNPRQTVVSLHWSSRSAALVHAVTSMLGATQASQPQEESYEYWSSIESNLNMHIAVGQRLDVDEVLEQELQTIKSTEFDKSSTLVLVCAPPALAHSVQARVSALGRTGVRIEYCEECFSW